MSVVNEQVDQLRSMGFDEADSRRALELNNNDLERAVNWIFNRGGGDAIIKSNPNQLQQNASQPHQSIQTAANQKNSQAASSKVNNFITKGINIAVADLPPGFSRGRVSKFFEKNREGQPGYGFIEPLESKFAGDLYFKWAHVVSNRIPLKEASRRIQSNEPLDMAIDHPEEPFVAAGDIVAYRVSMQKHYVDKKKPHAAPRQQEMAVDVCVLELAKNARFRRSQADASSGENAPMQPVDVHGNSIASASASASVPSLNNAVPSIPVSELMNKRVRGVIQQINEPSNDGHAKPHGTIILHHVKYTPIFFFFDQFNEAKHQAAASFPHSGNQLNDIVNALRAKIHAGDVVEFTLTFDKVLSASRETKSGLTAVALVIVPTLSYAQIHENAKRGRNQEDTLLDSDQMIALASTVPLVYIQGSYIDDDESRHLEFKSLTRSASSTGMQGNLARTADKYMNSFLNSSGGVILFGIENDGLVAGLEVNKKDRDNLRLTIDGYMSESVPPVSPKLYSFRFIRVYRLYKSSWVKLDSSNVWREGSFGAADLTKMMLQPEPTDRLEQLDLYVIAIITGRGDTSVPFYQTSGKGHQSKESFIRREGSTVRMTPVDIAQRTKLSVGEHSKQVDDLLRSITQQVTLGNSASAFGSGPHSQNFVDDIVKQVEARMKASIGPSSYSLASAPASLQSSPASSLILPPPPQQMSASVGSLPMKDSLPITSSIPAAQPVPSAPEANRNLEVPAGLLLSLKSMGYSAGDVLNAMDELHSSQQVNFKNVFTADSTDAQNADAIDKILNIIDSKSKASMPPPSAKKTSEGQRSEGQTEGQRAQYSHGEGQPPIPQLPTQFAIAHPEGKSEVKDTIPCELCKQDILVTEYEAHSQNCRGLQVKYLSN